MKKILYLFCFTALISSCQKDDTTEPVTPPADTTSTNNGGTISATLPSAFTQKVLVEMFAGATYGNVPDGLTKLDACTNSNSNRIYSVCIHDNDAMAISSLNMTMATTFGYSSIPSGMVNRIPSLGNVNLQPSQWQSNASADMAKTAKCGLAITSTNTSLQASIEVDAGFLMTMTGSYNLTVYLVEEEVAGSGSTYNQVNNYNTVSSSPYYNLGNPIVGFKHNHVIRKVCTANLGDPITASNIAPGNILKKNISTSVAGFNVSKLYIIAFVNKIGSNGAQHEIMNVQKAKLGTTKNWD